MTRAVFSAALAVAAFIMWTCAAMAQPLGGLARLVAAESRIISADDRLALDLALSQPVPFRVFAVADPHRVVLDFREVAFGDWAQTATLPAPITALETGPSPTEGWSRLVITLQGPMAVDLASMQVDDRTGQAVLALDLHPTTDAAFRAASVPEPRARVPRPAVPIAPADDGRVVVVIDPGHGGVDPGAVRGDVTEAALVLTFARELRDLLTRSDRVEAVLTREADVFVPLPTRVTLAREAEADVFLSIHADALAEGRARGATVYTLSETASDAAAAALAEQHDRADLLQGVDLHGADDRVAGVLMDLARRDTAPRSEALAEHLVAAIDAGGLRLHRRPLGQAGFTVLRAADIPSVLLEIGFMSDRRDLANIQSADWRREMQTAIAEALFAWANEDVLRRSLALQ